MGDRTVIDLRRPKNVESTELRADLVIEIDMLSEGYLVAYYIYCGDNFVPHSCFDRLTREQLVVRHIQAIRDVKPKTVVIRTGQHSTGHPRDIPLHPGVVKSIIEGKITAAELVLHG